MKAIVLTYDRYRPLTEHMIFKYEELWPDHPFCFRIPYQNLPAAVSAGREYLKSPAGIKNTVLRLLEDLDDDEWIYWCIDDKYPVVLDLPRAKALAAQINDLRYRSVDGILFCRTRDLLKKKYLTGAEITDDEGNVYLERKGYEQIWLHQFLRAKVIRYLFESFPDDIPHAKAMDSLKRQVKKPVAHRLFVSRENFAVFGESTTRGMLTENCYESMIKNTIALPEGFAVAKESKFMGKMEKKKGLYSLTKKILFRHLYSGSKIKRSGGK
jgi:hypothetical protein